MRSLSDIRQCTKLNILFLILFLIAFSQNSWGQNTNELESKKKKVEQSIQKTQQQLKQTKDSKASTLKDFNSLQKKIDVRKGAIDIVQTEIQYVSTIMNKKYSDISSLKSEIGTLKKEYARVMKSAYKASLMTNEWMLILSSSSMNQAFNRWMYLRNIKKDRKAKAYAIGQKQLLIEEELANLENMKSGKQVLLNKEQGQSNLLLKDLKKKNVVLSNLTQDEKKLINDLTRQKKQQRAIAADIEKAIRKEIEKKEKQARELAAREKKKEKERETAESSAKNKNVSTTKSEVKTETVAIKSTKLTEKKEVVMSETPESASLSSDFQANRGRFAWPVRRGVIVRGFGKQVHPELSHVTIVNNGIDIKTDANAEVSAIFTGEVVHIAFLSGYKNTVMVNHGKYYTIYSNLDQVNVTKGQKLKKGDKIGRAAVNGDTGNTEVHFELWNKQSPLNPAIWLKS